MADNNKTHDSTKGASPRERRVILDFRPGDTVRVHGKILEGNKERIQVFEGVVIKRTNRNKKNATFAVRKVSYNVGVERTFYLHSPRIDKIEVIGRGKVRRAKLFYLRELRGKSSKIKSTLVDGLRDVLGEEEIANLEDASTDTAEPLDHTSGNGKSSASISEEPVAEVS